MSSYPYYHPAHTPQPIDTRTLVQELEELEEREECQSCSGTGEEYVLAPEPSHFRKCESCDGTGKPQDPLDDDERERMEAIRALIEDLPTDGITLIPEGGFEEYARTFAEDVDGIDLDSPLASYVDWERYANDVRMDYTSVEFDGTTYYYR